MVVRIAIGLVATAVAAALAGHRLRWLYRVARAGQPAPERVAAVREHPGRDVGTEMTEVIGQRKLLKWTAPGAAHAVAAGAAKESLEVVDVAQVLMRSVAPPAEATAPTAQTEGPPFRTRSV